MDWLKELIKNNPSLALLLPAFLSSLNFLGHLLIAVSDGNLDPEEVHQLTSSANGFEMIALFLIIVALKNNKRK